MKLTTQSAWEGRWNRNDNEFHTFDNVPKKCHIKRDTRVKQLFSVETVKMKRPSFKSPPPPLQPRLSSRIKIVTTYLQQLTLRYSNEISKSYDGVHVQAFLKLFTTFHTPQFLQRRQLAKLSCAYI